MPIAPSAPRDGTLRDDVTGLPDRDALERHLASADAPVALLVLDIDHFTGLNASLGSAAGNALLADVADRLRRACPAGSYLARTGGNAFSVLVEGPHAGRAESTALAERMLTAMTAAFDLDRRVVRLSACVGVALPLDADADGVLLVDDLHRRADLALAEAKASARGQFAVWEPHLSLRSAQRLESQQDLRAALARPDGLTAHYQPIVSVRTREVTALECLVRRNGPAAAAGAEPLVAAAEDTGLTAALDRRVVDLVRHDLAALRSRQDDREVRVHVNVSADGLADRGLVDAVGQADDADGRLCVEVTEHALVAAGSVGARHLEELRAAGHLVALDDFGAGYTSLATLAALPADVLKLDRSLMFDVDTDIRRRAVLAGAVTLARDLGLVVVAEGVETEAQHDVLMDLGCDEAQGWLHGRPTALAPLQRSASDPS